MALSQFTIYSSGDVSGPGLLTGQVGSLITLLDACLVNGYTGKTAAGWSKNGLGNSGNCGAYKQGSGSLMCLHINDNAPSAGGLEAWATGWETLTAVGGVGVGSGQFPLPAQLLTTGHTVVRKSATSDATGRTWLLFADASTFYLFTNTADFGVYLGLWFGDIFSLNGSSDAYRCLLIGGQQESGNQQINLSNFPNQISTAQPGHYMPRPWGGIGTSTQVCKMGDGGKTTPIGFYGMGMSGLLQCPNGPDNALYLAPVQVIEPGGPLVRGRLRGMYQVCHVASNFSNGQTFSGAGDYAGKSFIIVTPVNGGGVTYGFFCALETSATVETN